MKDKPSIAAGPSRPFSIELLKIWDVEADQAYDVRCKRQERSLVAIRTLSGAGELHTDKASPIALKADSVIMVELSKIRRYRCEGDLWKFWWFEMASADPLPCALETAYTISGCTQDDVDFTQAFTKLQSPLYPVRCIASASFTSMLHRWLGEAKLTRDKSPYRQIIETIIERIHSDVSADWTLARLSSEAGLCETLFRKEFRKATGDSPAHFIREARLQAALQLQQQNLYTIAAIAEMLNFSSAFHLSAAFKKRFGISPSEV